VKPKLIGINHVAIEVGDVDEAVAWYGQFFEFGRRGRAFIDMGDQFLALEGRRPEPRAAGHFGLVVDDKESVRRALTEAGVAVSGPPGLDFRDPWGNHVQVVDYREIQFLKAPEVARAMDIESLEKTERARAELEAKGIAILDS
jgi:lactoylglutathione lyase